MTHARELPVPLSFCTNDPSFEAPPPPQAERSCHVVVTVHLFGWVS